MSELFSQEGKLELSLLEAIEASNTILHRWRLNGVTNYTIVEITSLFKSWLFKSARAKGIYSVSLRKLLYYGDIVPIIEDNYIVKLYNRQAIVSGQVIQWDKIVDNVNSKVVIKKFPNQEEFKQTGNLEFNLDKINQIKF